MAKKTTPPAAGLSRGPISAAPPPAAPDADASPRTADPSGPPAEPGFVPPRLRQGNAPLCPYCSKKNGQGEIVAPVVCLANRSEAFFTRYYCPTADCTFSAKVPRGDIRSRIDAAREADAGFSAR